MTEQANLLVRLHQLRELLESPTKLSLKDQRLVRREAQRLGDACWCNAGWYASKTRGELKGSGSTKTLSAEMNGLIELLEAHAKPKRGKGRPADKINFVDALVILPEFLAGQNRDKDKTSIVNDIVKRGLLDKKKKTTSHVRRLDNLAKRPAKAGPCRRK